ncbi:GNAT family N-acetyltransferase [Burkholderia gladioli]|uniref:GNAT family N-acetyltransferase n=1 Tax=Burkholderia gladioli TaxID=28095 RepID=UPI0015E686EA|nr:GNAT family N-acetyltransferase [Burkholderia gladioli]MBA1363169.1 GNAT family N-acetyltransferase [Burkholderia gladioli]
MFSVVRGFSGSPAAGVVTEKVFSFLHFILTIVMSESIDLAVEAWLHSRMGMCDVLDEVEFQVGQRGVQSFSTSIPISSINGVLSSTADVDLDELRNFAENFRGRGAPWSIQTRNKSQSISVESIARDKGLTNYYESPFMTKVLGEADSIAPPFDNNIYRIGARDSEIYRRTLAAGFEVSERFFEELSAPRFIDRETVAAYLMFENGVAVATAFGSLNNGYVGVFNVSTIPDYRGRGFGRAITQRVLRDGYLRGARAAFLHSSPSGFRVYESLGFVTKEMWQVYTVP